jgi:tryptophan synthase alpha chain
MADPPGGLGRIAAAFAAARAEGRAALMPYMMGGFPDLATSARVAEAYADAGADLIELGVPYSDPLADGPVIHAAATRALEAGTTLDDVLAICEGVASRVPVLPMVYANMALTRGPDRFADELAEAGAAGAIVPDLPPGEDSTLPQAMARMDLALVRFVTPTTPPDRRESILDSAEGFVYVVSLAGVTGERDRLPAELGELLADVRARASAPIAVGFGISSPERVAEAGTMADGVIVGSRLVREVADAPGPDQAVEAARAFVERARAALSAS